MVKSFHFDIDNKDNPSAIVVEDQPVIWDYAETCLSAYYNVTDFCTNTQDAEKLIRENKPDLVWLDCYLGEINDSTQGIKNSGLELAKWIRSHFPEIKLFLFTGSNEVNILRQAQSLGVEGIALGGKYISNKNIIIEGIKKISQGKKWLSPNLIEDMVIDDLKNLTVFEFCVITSMIIGKSTNQIAEELDTTRKMINNAASRVKQKLFIDPEMNREDFLEACKDLLKDSFNTSLYYNLTELTTINAIVNHCLSPILDELKNNGLHKKKILKAA